MKPEFDFRIRTDGRKLFAYPLEERQLVYMAQTCARSMFSIDFDWVEVSEDWVTRAVRDGWRFC